MVSLHLVLLDCLKPIDLCSLFILTKNNISFDKSVYKSIYFQVLLIQHKLPELKTIIQIHGEPSVSGNVMAQLFRPNAFSANTFSLSVLLSLTAIYSQSIVNTNNFFTYFYKRNQISRK